MFELTLCPLSRGCSVQFSVCGSANKEPTTLPPHIHSVANGRWRLGGQRSSQASGPAIGIEHDELIIWASTSSSKCGLRHGSSNYV